MARTRRKLHQYITTSGTCEEINATYNAAVYTRLSVEDNNLEDGDSIEAQKEMLIEFVNEQDDMKLCEVYTDNGFTGTNFERDDYKRMMTDIRDGKINCIVVKDLSRFARNYIEAQNFIEKIFPFLGVRFISVNDNYDSKVNDVTDIMVAMRNIINHAYVKDVSRKIKSMFETKQNNGDFIGWSAPYGYLKSPDNNNQLIIDPITAPIVSQIFKWKVEGLGFVIIARKLNEMGIPTPRQRNIENGKYKNAPTDGQFWTDASVSWIIKNPVYAGHMTQHKYTRTGLNGKQKQLDSSEWVIVPNTHEPIVSEELWDEAQAVTRRNAEKCIQNKGSKANIRNDAPLRGLLVCPHCNKVMQRRVEKKWGLAYYFCSMRRANPNCKTKFIREDALLETILAVVKTKIAVASDIKQSLKNLSKSGGYLGKLNDLQTKIKEINVMIEQNSKRRGKLFEILGDDLITEDEYKRMKIEYAEKDEYLRSDLEHHEQEYQKYTNCYSPNNQRIAELLQFKEIQNVTKEMLAALIDKIIVYDGQNINIVWRFEDEYESVIAFAKGGLDNATYNS